LFLSLQCTTDDDDPTKTPSEHDDKRTGRILVKLRKTKKIKRKLETKPKLNSEEPPAKRENKLVEVTKQVVHDHGNSSEMLRFENITTNISENYCKTDVVNRYASIEGKQSPHLGIHDMCESLLDSRPTLPSSSLLTSLLNEKNASFHNTEDGVSGGELLQEQSAIGSTAGEVTTEDATHQDSSVIEVIVDIPRQSRAPILHLKNLENVIHNNSSANGKINPSIVSVDSVPSVKILSTSQSKNAGSPPSVLHDVLEKEEMFNKSANLSHRNHVQRIARKSLTVSRGRTAADSSPLIVDRFLGNILNSNVPVHSSSNHHSSLVSLQHNDNQKQLLLDKPQIQLTAPNSVAVLDVNKSRRYAMHRQKSIDPNAGYLRRQCETSQTRDTAITSVITEFNFRREPCSPTKIFVDNKKADTAPKADDQPADLSMKTLKQIEQQLQHEQQLKFRLNGASVSTVSSSQIQDEPLNLSTKSIRQISTKTVVSNDVNNSVIDLTKCDRLRTPLECLNDVELRSSARPSQYESRLASSLHSPTRSVSDFITSANFMSLSQNAPQYAQFLPGAAGFLSQFQSELSPYTAAGLQASGVPKSDDILSLLRVSRLSAAIQQAECFSRPNINSLQYLFPPDSSYRH